MFWNHRASNDVLGLGFRNHCYNSLHTGAGFWRADNLADCTCQLLLNNARNLNGHRAFFGVHNALVDVAGPSFHLGNWFVDSSLTCFGSANGLGNGSLTRFCLHLALLDSSLPCFSRIRYLVHRSHLGLSGHGALLNSSLACLCCVRNLLASALTNFVAAERNGVGIRLVNHLALHGCTRNFLSYNVWNPDLFAYITHGHNWSCNFATSAAGSDCWSCASASWRRCTSTTSWCSNAASASNWNLFCYGLVRTHILGNSSRGRYRIRTANLARTSSLFGVRYFDCVGYDFVRIDRNSNRVGNLFVRVNWNLNRIRYLFLCCYWNHYVVVLNNIDVVWDLNCVVNSFVDSRRNLNSVRLYFWNGLANGYLVGFLLNNGRWHLNLVGLYDIGKDSFVDSVWNFFRNSFGNVDLVRFFDLARNRHVHCVSDLLGFLLWNHNRGCASPLLSPWHLTGHSVSSSTSFHFGSGLVDRSHFGNLRWDHDGLFNVADLSAAAICVSATYNRTANNTAGTGRTAATAITCNNTTGPK